MENKKDNPMDWNEKNKSAHLDTYDASMMNVSDYNENKQYNEDKQYNKEKQYNEDNEHDSEWMHEETEKIAYMLKKDAQNQEIPNSIQPKEIKKKLEAIADQRYYHASKEDCLAQDGEKNYEHTKKQKKRLTYSKVLAAAASICVLIGCTAMAAKFGLVGFKENPKDALQKDDRVSEADVDITNHGLHVEDGKGFAAVTYEDVYASMSEVWEKTASYRSEYDLGIEEKETLEPAEDMFAYVENDVNAGAASDSVKMDAAATLSGEKSFGATNVQTVGVDEGDIVKNDGRYLYQLVSKKESGQTIQIVDTVDGLKKLADLGDFESVSEFYVWNDLLIVIENKYIEQTYAAGAGKGIIACYDLLYYDNCYHQITIYDIKDRSLPKEQKVFTLQGSYMSSRIADGYFYGFSRYYANPGEGEEDYDAYIPLLDGEHLEEACIVLPKECDGTSYLVMVSIDLNQPSEFADTIGIVSDSDRYYVSSNNIYVTYGEYEQPKEEGWKAEKTSILRFSYKKGQMTLEAEGSIQGYLNDTFSLDEYDNHLRVVTTVNESYWKPIKDDRTGENLGMGIEDSRQSNALYVLDDSLTVVGKIEGLAEDEQIYSARFFGNTGYFVTFRQMDPLFAVDLTDPANPVVLSELKVSGFSEYLHFYGEDRLFGFGMEADEETGWQEGLKLSMFDISNPADVQEISRHTMREYYYSEALYNHRAILIHPTANVIGFYAEGNPEDEYVQEYLIFAYEKDAFVEKMKINTKTEDYGYYNVRGTFIEDMFYLLSGDGRVESYDLNTGEQKEVLETIIE